MGHLNRDPGPVRLGRRQAEVLRAARDGRLIRYTDGGWVAGSTGCTRPAESVARRGLLAEGKHMATVTLGRGIRPGRHITDQDLLTLAATDDRLADDGFVVLRQTSEGRDIEVPEGRHAR